MAIKLTGLHFLLTYRCTHACDHCFVWGSPDQTGTMTLAQVRDILRQAREVGTIEWIYFEGGEPFLFYMLLSDSVRAASEMGFKVGIVTNGYWATSTDDAAEYLRPLAEQVGDLSVSSDLYHADTENSAESRHACAAAAKLEIPTDVISIAQPNVLDAPCSQGKLPAGQSAVRYRGRAAVQLTGGAARRLWSSFTECPYENLRDPGRVHVDPCGYVHVCQGIAIGNVFKTSLARICADFDPDRHPITAPLLEGGPARLARRYSLPYSSSYADACHLCFELRSILRRRFPDALAPDQMYGVPDTGRTAASR